MLLLNLCFYVNVIILLPILMNKIKSILFYYHKFLLIYFFDTLIYMKRMF